MAEALSFGDNDSYAQLSLSSTAQSRAQTASVSLV